MSDWGHRDVLDVILEYYAGQVDATMNGEDDLESRVKARAALEIAQQMIGSLSRNNDEALEIREIMAAKCRNYYRQSFFKEE